MYTEKDSHIHTGSRMVLSLLYVTLFTGAAALGVLQDPPSLVLREGQTAAMFCTLEAPQRNWTSLYYYWKVNSTIIRPSSRVTITSDPRSPSSSLHISSVTARDSGVYECEMRGMENTVPKPYMGNRTRLLVAVPPVITLREDKEKQLLICEARRFYPPELDISWSFSNMENQTQDILVENADGTYTKSSTVEIEDILRGQEVTCSLEHISLPAPLRGTLCVPGRSPARYHYLLLLLFILPVLFVVFIYRRHRSRSNGGRPATPETCARRRASEDQTAQDRDGDSDVHYAAINHAQKPRERVPEEESTEYAPVRPTAAMRPDTATCRQDMEEPSLSYATLRMSPPESDSNAAAHREPGPQHPRGQ